MRIACNICTTFFVSLLLQKCFKNRIMAKRLSRNFVVEVKSLSHVQHFVTSWTAAHQASLSITISLSLFKLKFIESVIPSKHLILCCPLLFLPSDFPSIRVFPMSQLFSSMQFGSLTQSCLTLCDPMDYIVHGILQARILEWVGFPFYRGSS